MTTSISDYAIAAITIEEAAAHYGVKVSAIRGRSRVRTIARARAMAMYLVRDRTRLSSPEIGQVFRRHHATVLVACRAVERATEEAMDDGWALLGAIHLRRAIGARIKAEAGA